MCTHASMWGGVWEEADEIVPCGRGRLGCAAAVVVIVIAAFIAFGGFIKECRVSIPEDGHKIATLAQLVAHWSYVPKVRRFEPDT